MGEPLDILFRGGLVALDSGLVRADVGVRGEVVVEVSPRVREEAREVVDASGLIVLPGAIDSHVHFGVPVQGEWSCDDHRIGSLAAICGGVTCAGDFTVQNEGEGLVASVERRLKEAGTEVYCDWFLHANLTSVSRQALEEIQEVVNGGVSSFKVFMAYEGMRIDARTLEEVLRKVKEAKGLVMVHAEDHDMVLEATSRLVSSGRTRPRWFFQSRPPEAEAKAVATVGNACRKTGSTAYIVHLSSLLGLRAALEERTLGARLLLETCPQYLVLGRRPRPNVEVEALLCAPPIRLRRDREGLLGALAKGLIDVLATDHCPFTLEQKTRHRVDFRLIPNGLPGVETLLPIACDLALRGRLPWGRLVQALSKMPAKIFGLSYRKGALEPGRDADIVLLDPSQSVTIEPALLHSATTISPYTGLTVRGAIVSVYLRGQLAARRVGRRVEPVGPPFGRYIKTVTPEILHEGEEVVGSPQNHRIAG